MNDREQIAALGAHMASKRKDVIDERLLLRATPALLDGWCGPVVLPGVEMHGAIVTHGMSYVYVWSDGSICHYEPPTSTWTSPGPSAGTGWKVWGR